jgi:tetratricopeptide (TPR) repeat protein
VGVDPEEAKALVPVARKIAKTYPDDPAVLSALAEAEFDAGNDDAAITEADQALAIDPTQINAHVQKGYALARKARSGASASTSWKDVRAQFVKANAVENDHPIPLLYFYLSYKQAGVKLTQNAIDGLEWALKLAPYDPSLRWLVAQQMVDDERLRDAIITLGPLAYSPHPSDATERRSLCSRSSKRECNRARRQRRKHWGLRPAESEHQAGSASESQDATRNSPMTSLGSVAFVVASVSRQTFILAGLSLPIAQSVFVARGTNGALVLRHRIADLDIVVTIVDQIFILFLVLITLPLTSIVL